MGLTRDDAEVIGQAIATYGQEARDIMKALQVEVERLTLRVEELEGRETEYASARALSGILRPAHPRQVATGGR